MSHGNVHSDTAKKEQIVTEFFAKSLHIILESRSPFVSSRNHSGEQALSSPSSSSSSSSSYRPRDKWFNLALRECPAALENIDFFRQSNLDPMVVDVILIKRQRLTLDPVNVSPKWHLVKNPSKKERPPSFINLEQDEFGLESGNEKVIERWVVQYESGKCSGSGSKRSSGNVHTLYKQSIILLRSLYSTVRLFPAYKLFRDLISSSQIRTYTLTHRVSSFAEPFTRREEADMQRFVFAPVETSCGRLSLSLSYCSPLSEVSSEPSTPMSPQFIPDYVGSPLADPLKRFPSLPVSHSSPSYSPFSRRHSWSYDAYAASPPSVFPSPSPTYSDSHAPSSNSRTQRQPPMSLPDTGTFQANTKSKGYDEYWPSPGFSPSTSSSSSIYQPASAPSRSILRSESAPVSIPHTKPHNTSAVSNKQALPPSLRPGNTKTDKGVGTSGSAVDKYSLGRDESERFSRVRRSTSSSPQISFSRSSSRLSIQDDFDDQEFACHFAVDNDDIIDSGSRPESFDQKCQPNEPYEAGSLGPVRKSQDAAVGALVLMLKKAPPLRQDYSASIVVSAAPKTTCSDAGVQDSNENVARAPAERPTYSSIVSSGISQSKTTADAIVELRGYRKMKEFILKQAGSSHVLD